MDKYDRDREVARKLRLHEDQMKGISTTKGAQRGDFPLCRRLDKTIKDRVRFARDPNAVKQIENEYYGLQREVRKYG